MGKNEAKKKAQDLQIAKIGYGNDYEEFKKEVGDNAEEILFSQMNRVAKLFGFKKAWFC